MIIKERKNKIVQISSKNVAKSPQGTKRVTRIEKNVFQGNSQWGKAYEMVKGEESNNPKKRQKRNICPREGEQEKREKRDIIRNKPKNTIRGETTYRKKGKKPIPRGKNTITGKSL